MDGEFETLRGDLADLNIALNTTAWNEHVGDVERYIQTIKERMQAVYNTHPTGKCHCASSLRWQSMQCSG